MGACRVALETHSDIKPNLAQTPLVEPPRLRAAEPELGTREPYKEGNTAVPCSTVRAT